MLNNCSSINQIALLVCCAAFLFNGCQTSKTKNENPLSEEEQESAEVRPQVTFAVADDKPIYQYIESQGVVEANQSVQLKPKISGYVDSSYIRQGRRVRKGQTLLTLNQQEYAIAVQEAQNKYEEARQKYRIEMGMRSGRDSTRGTNGHDDPGEQLVRITTGLAQAEINLEQARLNLSYATLKAPFSGVLATNQRLSSGTYINAGTKVGQLVDDRTVRIRFDVLESELSNIEKGMSVQLTAPNGEELQGQVQAVAPVVDTKTKTGTVVVQANNSSQVLRPGMTVEGRIQTLKKDGKVRVPRSAILSRDGGRTLLFKLKSENDQVQWVYVEPTAQNSEWAIVDHEQVSPGDTIAVDRHFSLSHQQIVEPRMTLRD